MVGHTGDFRRDGHAVETVDRELGAVVSPPSPSAARSSSPPTTATPRR
jgi:hypothetical protein